MFGLIGAIRATGGNGAALAAAIREGARDMPGCRSYVVALAEDDPDLVWITELWDDAAAHEASLRLPSVQAAIGKARPLIAGFEHHIRTRPLA